MIRRPPRSPLFPYPPLFRSPFSGPVRAMITAVPQTDALVMNALLPFRIHSSPESSARVRRAAASEPEPGSVRPHRSEEHTSELQSRLHLVCRLLLEKKKKQI